MTIPAGLSGSNWVRALPAESGGPSGVTIIAGVTVPKMGVGTAHRIGKGQGCDDTCRPVRLELGAGTARRIGWTQRRNDYRRSHSPEIAVGLADRALPAESSAPNGVTIIAAPCTN